MNYYRNYRAELLEFTSSYHYSIIGTNIKELHLSDEYDWSDRPERICDFYIESNHLVIKPLNSPNITITCEIQDFLLTEGEDYIFTLQVTTPQGEQWYIQFEDRYNDGDSDIRYLRVCALSFKLCKQAKDLLKTEPPELLTLLEQYLFKSKGAIMDHKNSMNNIVHLIKDTIYDSVNEEFSCYEDIIALDKNLSPISFHEIEYFNDYLIKLAKLMKRKNYVQNDSEAIVFTWYLLKTVAIQYFHTWIVENTSIKSGFDLKSYQKQFKNIHLVEYDEEQMESIMMYFLIKEGLVSEDDFYEDIDDVFNRKAVSSNSSKGTDEIDDFETFLLGAQPEAPSTTISNSISITDIDTLTGIEFENLLEQLFMNLGYRVTTTKQSGDQGVDLILKKGDQTIGVQAKRSSTPIGNKAIQEITAGIHYYDLRRGMVITNNTFTSFAYDLARSTDIILWDRNKLMKQLELLNELGVI